MSKDTYISELIKGLGFAFDPQNHNEIIINYPIKYLPQFLQIFK